MPNKPNSSKPLKRGLRRQQLQEHQDNRGEAKSKTSYRDSEGNPID